MRHLQRMADAGTAAAVLVAALLTTNTGHHLRDPLAAALAVAACAPLVVRRRWPYPALLVSTLAAEGYLAHVSGGGGTLILAAPLIALYTVAELGRQRHSLWVAGALVLMIGVFHTIAKSGHWLGPENLALAALGGLAVAAGEATRSRRAYQAEALLRARERVTAERLRIARDLHDSVGHHLALINVQAGVAGHVLTGDPPVRETLDQIRQSARSALDELRDAVGLLRTDEPAAPVEPAVGLGGLDDLIATFERAGLRITCRRDDDSPLSPATDVVAYRVVQESLTNARKHAGQVDVRLTLHRRDATLTVVVENDGPMVAPRAESHGITGMRERVAAIGGSLDAEPRPLGGFRVSCRLPAGNIGNAGHAA
ncbi:sensor histidine kinase [Paractinoplanes globisporus]|uniref:histidine kinase n=1 Tax=Paractinoplanes globisporus TaxID=113565 RepID=A0ABW6WZC3_9ACTN|nr:sensor histidine kinase [Actinoplanes globisporus]